MRRREFISALGVATASSLLIDGASPARAEAPGRVYRLGHLANTAASEALSRDVLLPELARLGFVLGRNLAFVSRVGEPAAMPALMGEILAARPDAIVAVGGPAAAAAGAATTSVPIVVFGANPVELGLAASLARPGRNVTGVTILFGALEAKRLSILSEAVPGRRKLAALVSAQRREATEPTLLKAAADLGVELFVVAVAAPADYPAAFAAMRNAGAEALLVGAAPELFRDGAALAARAIEAGLPTVCEWAEMARTGCMIGYGPSRAALRRRLAAQIALIFRGDPPGTIPIELPTTFEFALNQRVARALGVALPPALLARADEVIE